MSSLNNAFALRLSKILKEKKMSKYRLEKLCGLTHTAMRNIFNGKSADLKFSTIVKITNALNITLGEFFTDKVFKIDFNAE